MKLILSMIIILLFNIYNSNSQVDTNYVKPEELENGWDALYGKYFFYEPYPLNSYVYYLSVSKDGKWLAYLNDGIWIYNIINKIKTKIYNPLNWTHLEWGNDNTTLRFWSNNVNYYYNVNTKNFDSVLCSVDSEYCPFGLMWASDNYAYFSYPYGIPSPDSSIYRENVNLSSQLGFPINEKIIDTKFNSLKLPNFPPYNIDYFAHPKGCTQGSKALCGFIITRNFYFINEYEIILDIPNNEWNYSYIHAHTIGAHYPLKVSTEGCIYIYLSYRNQRENYSSTNDPFDSINRIARDASGWYRVDTSGKNLVQLVRSWVVYNCGLTVTGDGETIYYAFLLPDTTTCIMRMNKYGKNKELVLKIEPETIGVEDNKLVTNSIEIIPNPATNKISIEFPLEFMSNARVSIFDCLGNELLTKNSAGKRIEFDCSPLPNGIYFCVVRAGSKAYSGKFVMVK
ncbi:MAG: T9SS type A sorting domain-containing protein [Ignavibacteriae bacterium]|nr:T9SS type A sorting domain-containing protein [Ignavibacteriota bacterium]